MEIEKFLTNKFEGGIQYQLIIEKVPFSYSRKRFWLKTHDDKDFIELHLNRNKYSSYSQEKKEDCYELVDVNQNKNYTLYITNNDYLFTGLMSHTFLKEDKINETTLNINNFKSLPSNVYSIQRLVKEVNNNVYYLFGYKKYNNTYKENDSYIFIKYDLTKNTKQEYTIINNSMYLDGGTTDLLLKDKEEISHYYHWDSKLKKPEDRHNVFDDTTLIDVESTQELVEKFNKLNKNIIIQI